MAMADDRLSKDEQLEIVCMMIDKEEEGIVRLLRAYARRVTWLLLDPYEGVLTEQDVEEVLWNAAYKAYTRAEQFDDSKGTLGGWFYTIARRCAIDKLRGLPDVDERPRELLMEPVLDSRMAACVDDTDEYEPEAVKDLLEEIETLGEQQRFIMKADMAAGGEADAEFLAQRLGIPKQHVFSYRHKAHVALKKHLERRAHSTATIGSST